MKVKIIKKISIARRGKYTYPQLQLPVSWWKYLGKPLEVEMNLNKGFKCITIRRK